ncbi:TPA: 30S ribosomal protein S9 [Candidatus Saccharibacteria bacterium]|nr:MAG: 30S ribosomal protein S9 [Candidatus Saccharibacteria bacterium GW2011_GWA2_46_10]OGL35551.1 MAG: 30S ribosomal protein S9 [Candidatus Saccharibacteria bacterium RIFCSPHIGHO2_12_FULL_47_17]HCM51835.1 30S ribosomal protein S9 [Candidatus Saccharibacteria bacterium]
MAASYFYGLGRRKSSTARVRLSNGKGVFLINGKSWKDYFADNKYLQYHLLKPFNVLELDPEKYDVSVKVQGGGHPSQTGATSLGIAKALIEMNPDFHSTLKKAALLSRDPREKERKKFGLRGARKKQQYSKR